MTYLRILMLLILGMQLACSSAPPPPPAPPPAPPKPKLINGIPLEAYNLFKEGVSLLQQKPAKLIEANQRFSDAISKHESYTIARLNLAYTFEKLGRYTDATSAYRELIARKVSDARVNLAYGRSLLLSNHPKQAISEFESVLKSNPNSLEARNNLAAAYLKLKDRKTCLKYVKEVLAIQPKNVPAIINLGLLYLKDKNYDLAELMFKKAIGYDKENARAHSNLGLTYYQINKLPIAVVNFEKAINLDPTMDEARLNLGSIYLDYLDYARALEQFKYVLARFPKHYEAMVGAADTLYGTGKYQEAVQFYLTSLTLNEKNGEVYLRLGKLYEEKMVQSDPKSKDKAVDYYEKYIRMFNPPADAKVHSTLANLKALMELERSQATSQQTEATTSQSESKEDTEVPNAEGQSPKDSTDTTQAEPEDSTKSEISSEKSSEDSPKNTDKAESPEKK